MRAISLEAYSIIIREHRSKKHLALSEFGDDSNFLSLAEKYIMRLEGRYDNIRVLARCMTLSKIGRTNNSINGTLLTGEYGFQNTLVNSVTGVKSYDKERDDAEMEPFFFEIHVEEGATQGILIAQRYGHASVKPILVQYLRGEFKKDF